MISHKDMLNIIYTEAIEFGGLPEIPGHKHGAKVSYHAPKRLGRGPFATKGRSLNTKNAELHYKVRVVRKANGSVAWED